MDFHHVGRLPAFYFVITGYVLNLSKESCKYVVSQKGSQQVISRVIVSVDSLEISFKCA